MSVSHKRNTDNNWSQQSGIPHPSVEEKKWRKMNNGEHLDLMLISPQRNQQGEGILRRRLSEKQEIIPKSYPTQLNGPRIHKTFYVRLAEESPKRNCDEFSDSSTYDSFNCRETDVCRDSSDTESSLSEDSGTTINVVEYEVASASNSEDLFTNDSSSGTDDFFLAAVATAICHTSKCSSDFADTGEDSSDNDAPYDSEFSTADYWVCVKCKNKQNNPLFRYCEKCYQIRKTHFPPRPRLRKNRSALKRNRSLLGIPSIKRPSSASEVDESGKRRKTDDIAQQITPTSSSSSLQSGPISTLGRLVVGISPNKLNSTAESSTDEDNNPASRFYKDSNGNDFVQTHADNTYYPKASTTTNKLNKQKHAQHLRTAAKRKLPKGLSKLKMSTKHDEQNVIPSNKETETDFALSQSVCGSSQSTLKDSGFSSAPSSQERKCLSEQQNCENDGCSVVSDGGNGGSSDTVCDELNDSDIADISEKKNYIPSTTEFDFKSQEPALDRRVSDLALSSTIEAHAISPLVQSVSECSDAYTNVQASSSNPDLLQISAFKKSKLRSLQPITGIQSNEKDGEFPSYGSCMTCLTEPKNGVFVHSRFLHLCCCYKCAVKIWSQNKKCPICNCAVKNVKKLFVY